MRLNEFASAEEKLELWKLVNDCVWTAIETQVQQQAKERAAKAASQPKSSKAAPIKRNAPPPIITPPKKAKVNKPPLPKPSDVKGNLGQLKVGVGTTPNGTTVGPTDSKGSSAQLSPTALPKSIQPITPLSPQQMRQNRQKTAGLGGKSAV